MAIILQSPEKSNLKRKKKRKKTIIDKLIRMKQKKVSEILLLHQIIDLDH